MASKKIQKYVPQTAFPKARQEWRTLQRDGVTFSQLILALKERHRKQIEKNGPDAWLQYDGYVKKYDEGRIDDTNYLTEMNEWRYRRFCENVFPYTESFRKINEQFMAEFDSREDLQEIYRECVGEARWIYDVEEECIDLSVKDEFGYKNRPQTYKMFQYVISRSGRSKIELARDTPYVEGDLVLLRDTAIDRDCDPLRITRWSTEYINGQRTPDKAVQRIATVISVTDQLSQSWRPVKGSKVLKVMWLGGDGRVVDIEERWVKFHIRPTYKNGLKVREG